MSDLDFGLRTRTEEVGGRTEREVEGVESLAEPGLDRERKCGK